ncbi:hypothetical protein NDR87_08865 [Nocardia sp. CDC159]|uniref:Phthiocerol/phthiodiolone dimycocerosyl transferase n=1 Tax=Nocardia pulmonis TaxID=2951408 RepID=A0A9X2E3K6_9NOCA|nr:MULTISPECIES: hypothetical protein [Nocardia]MCM6773579.1 hypothetical protein [Nocardia pulmonis]MCM6786466.1 hypothetical protein [Nocardia sp. CDC159]
MQTVEQRLLSPGETNQLTIGVDAVIAQARIDGTVDPTLLQQALDLLTTAYPLLRSRIVESDAGYLLQYTAGERPPLRIVDVDADPFVLELNTPLHRDRGLARAGLFHHHGENVVSLVIDHAVADGRLVTTLLRRLLDYYTAATEARTPNPARGTGLEPALEDRLAEQYGTDQVPVAPALVSGAKLPTPARGPIPVQRFGVGHLALDRLATTAVTRRARAAGVSVHALLSGTVAAALSATVDGPIVLSFPIDLRPRLRPPLRPDAQLLAIGTVYAVIRPTASDDVTDLGRRIATQLTASLDLALPQRSLLQPQPLGASTLPTDTMSVSNMGLLDPPTLPTGLELRSLRFGTAVPQPTPILFAATTNGRLELDLTYDRTYFTDEQMTALTDGLHGRLTRFMRVAA